MSSSVICIRVSLKSVMCYVFILSLLFKATLHTEGTKTKHFRLWQLKLIHVTVYDLMKCLGFSYRSKIKTIISSVYWLPYLNNYIIAGPIFRQWHNVFSLVISSVLEIGFSEPKYHNRNYNSTWTSPLLLYGLPDARASPPARTYSHARIHTYRVKEISVPAVHSVILCLKNQVKIL
jgi:hypothetical protein